MAILLSAVAVWILFFDARFEPREAQVLIAGLLFATALRFGIDVGEAVRPGFWFDGRSGE